MVSPSLRIGFDFFGAGNVGDDLMLAGFLDLVPPGVVIRGDLPADSIPPMRVRFPRVEWNPLPAGKPHSGEVWIGPGDTPFQILSGRGGLTRLQAALHTHGFGSALMIGVGAEREARSEKVLGRAIVSRLDCISTRDQMSRDLLVDSFDAAPATISVGSDLANVFLQRASESSWNNSTRAVAAGVNYYAERFDLRTRLALVRFFRTTSQRPAVFLANELRPFRHAELALYVGHRRLWNLWNRRGVVPLVAPNYMAPRVEDLVAHLAQIGTVVAARYHCLLAAAWYGCKVCGIARSSKIEQLCQDLDIPTIRVPTSAAGLAAGVVAARRVDRERLHNLANLARRVHGEVVTRAMSIPPANLEAPHSSGAGVGFKTAGS
jgi:polysaccharide pyruvyl transferase WcaK-like protein